MESDKQFCDCKQQSVKIKEEKFEDKNTSFNAEFKYINDTVQVTWKYKIAKQYHIFRFTIGRRVSLYSEVMPDTTLVTYASSTATFESM